MVSRTTALDLRAVHGVRGSCHSSHLTILHTFLLCLGALVWLANTGWTQVEQARTELRGGYASPGARIQGAIAGSSSVPLV